MEMPFELWTLDLCGHKEPCIRWGPEAAAGRDIFEGRNWACLDLPAVDNLDLIRKRGSSDAAPATSTVEACCKYGQIVRHKTSGNVYE